MDFSHIILEEEQKELFIEIVETVKKIPRDERMKMSMIKTFDGVWLTIPSKDSGVYEINDIIDGDLDVLVNRGLLDLSYTSKGNEQYYIPPEGFKYYEWLMIRQGKPIERIEESTFKYFELGNFRKKYTEAYNKLRKAEEKLWASDTEESFTTIGHLCREAMQEFADQLYFEVFEEKSTEPKSHTVKRIRKVLKEKSSNLGETVENFLEALLPYWGTVSDLVQRQEHGAQKEKGEDINWEDSRRVVFQTANIMYELHRTLRK